MQSAENVSSSGFKSEVKRLLPAGMLRRASHYLELFRQFSAAPRNAYMDTTDFDSGLGQSSFVLYGLVRAMRPTICVEIGSARGRSACHVGLALKQNGHGRLFAIDPHTRSDWNDRGSTDTYTVLQQNISAVGVQKFVEIIRAYSADAARDWTSKIDLLFIDGDHSYEGVKRDWDLFLPHMSKFGVVAFHDTMWDLRPPASWDRGVTMGVPQFVDELRRAGHPVLTLPRDFGLSLVQTTVGGVALIPSTN
jgi:predicted O-methyltransferase YrrM